MSQFRSNDPVGARTERRQGVVNSPTVELAPLLQQRYGQMAQLQRQSVVPLPHRVSSLLAASMSVVGLVLAVSLSSVSWDLHAQSSGLQLGGEQSTEDQNKLDLGPAPKPATEPAAPSGSQTPGTPMPRDLEGLVRTKQGDWDVACEKSGSPCVMAQVGNDKSGTPVLEMVVRKLPQPQEVQGVQVVAVTDIITPLGVVLTSGLQMQIDNLDEQRAPFQICTEQGCLVREPLTEEAVSRFKKGGKSVFTVVAAQQGPVSATISLRGFTKAYNSLQ